MSRDAESIRATLREQVFPRRGFLGYCFDSYAASLEIFLHYNVGKFYLTLSRSFVMAAMFMGFAYLFSCDVEMRGLGEALGGKDYYTRAADSELQRNMAEADSSGLYAMRLVLPRAVGGSLWLRVFPVVVERHDQSLIWSATVILLVVSRLHMAWNFGRDRMRMSGLHHYPGEPLPIWNSLYIAFDRANFRLNLVRVVCEPLLCMVAGLVLALWLHRFHESGDRFLFVARWLFWGGLILGVKAYLDDRKRVEELIAIDDTDLSTRAREDAYRRRLTGELGEADEHERIAR